MWRLNSVTPLNFDENNIAQNNSIFVKLTILLQLNKSTQLIRSSKESGANTFGFLR